MEDLGVYSGTPGWVRFSTLTTEPNPTPNPTGGTRIDPLMIGVAFLSAATVLDVEKTEPIEVGPESPMSRQEMDDILMENRDLESDIWHVPR
ncbi:hypothetical protein AVEN_125585-1 [Araneus ventricosus]|uniref:Uncharacterized protein n=1 Tax=Araneus ventricosus TaxID=182803 RepID=A0A4Y2SQV4_ARAVE|nr:hypothetical protein AVEN_125585-1 [Araneus ventricosus]